MRSSSLHGMAGIVLLAAGLSGAGGAQAAVVAPSARDAVCATVACWAGSRPQAVSLRAGAPSDLTFSRRGVSTVRVTPAIRGRLAVPRGDGGDRPVVTVARVRRVAGVPGLPTADARGIVVSPGETLGRPLSLRFDLGRKPAAVVVANADGSDLHRVPAWRGRVDIPVIDPIAVVVVPGGARSRWFRAGPAAHMPETTWFKLEHVLAGVATSSTAPRARRGLLGAAPVVSREPDPSAVAARLAAVFARHREYVDWLRARHATDPSAAVEDVARVWGAMVHQEAVAAELGLADPDDVARDSAALADYLAESVSAWLAQLTRPCLREADAATVLRLMRFAHLRGLVVSASPADADGCPVRITGHVTVAVHQDLLSDRATGGNNIIDSTSELEVRLLTHGLFGYGATPETPTIIDEGTRVDFTGMTDYESRSSSATCAELIADNYRSVVTVLGPYAGPVDSLTLRGGDTGLVALRADWRYVALESTSTLFPTQNGCDWAYAERSLPRVEEVEAVGVVAGPGRTIAFDSWPDPFTHVTGTLTAEEVVG